MKYLGLTLLATLGLTPIISPPAASAFVFQQSEMNQEAVIAIAAPIGNESHQLLILEQINSSRECWSQNGDRVTPLLLDFDFTGICSRATDSNGYSVRVGDEDLGVQYTLRLSAENGILRLLASSNRDFTAPPIEIGRAAQRPGEFVAITLNPGWRITKRNYNGQKLGHYYFSNDQSLSALLASPSSPSTAIAVQPADQGSVPIEVQFPSSTSTESSPSGLDQPDPDTSLAPITIGTEPVPLSPPVTIPVQPATSIPLPSAPSDVESDVESDDDETEPFSVPIAVQPAPTTVPPFPATSSPSPATSSPSLTTSPATSSSSSPYQTIELDPSTVVAIASPVGEASYQLIVVEQLTETPACWAQEGDRIDPLLLDFDFFGICDRAAGSSGYSVRLANEDLGFQYGVRLVPENDTLRLVARSTQNLNAPAIDIGRAPLLPGEFVSITLNPGWRLTKRSYNGQPIRHYYFTNDQPLSALQSEGSLIASLPSAIPTLSPAPDSPPMDTQLPPPSTIPNVPDYPNEAPVDADSLPIVVVPAVIPGAEPLPLLTQPIRSTAPSTTSSTAPSTLPTQTVPISQPTALTPARVVYRVTVPAATDAAQERVREIVPDAFRQTINGEVVMQVGLFGDRQAAIELQSQLQRDGLTATIQQVTTP
jgi:hypothetical protein